MRPHVLDASAVLAFAHREPGGERVGSLLEGGLVSSVNWSEILQKSAAVDVDATAVAEALVDAGLVVVPFDAEDARGAASLWPIGRKAGLSLGDRACLALGLRRSAVVVTADRAWASLGLKLDLVVLR